MVRTKRFKSAGPMRSHVASGSALAPQTRCALLGGSRSGDDAGDEGAEPESSDSTSFASASEGIPSHRCSRQERVCNTPTCCTCWRVSKRANRLFEHARGSENAKAIPETGTAGKTSAER